MKFIQPVLVILGLLIIPQGVFAENIEINPDDPNAFIFVSLSEGLQKFGYSNFCTHTRSFACAPRLSYSTYHGMKGKFVSMKPVKQYMSYEFREVVLENGEKFFHVSNKKYGGVFSRGKTIVRLSVIRENEALVGKPIIQHSDIKVVSVNGTGGWFYFKLSNDTKFRSDQYKNFLKLVGHITNKASLDKLSKLLAEMHLTYDKMENRIFVRQTGMEDAPIRAYLGFKKKKPWLRMEVKYKADNWLFVNSYLVLADDYRYKSQPQRFSRDNALGTIWEWIDINPKSKQIKLLNKVATAAEVTVRFNGKNYHADKKMSEKAILDLNRILEIYKLLKKK